MVRNRNPKFNNQLEKRIQRLGNTKPKPERRPPSNVSFPHGNKITVTIPSQLQILEALSKQPSRKDKDEI